MPEGPEIRLAADNVFDAVGNAPLTHIDCTIPSLAAPLKRLVGRTIVAVDTHGKAMLTHFDVDQTLYSHNQLYGRWYTRKTGKLPSTNRQLRVGLHTDKGSAFLYSATDISLHTTDELTSHPFLRKLGPDILDRALTARDVNKHLQQPRFATRQLGSLYLDQGFLAGIGNYLRSEILYAAGLHYSWRPCDLYYADRMRLAKATLTIAKRAYLTRGVTVPTAFANRAKNAGQRRTQYRFAVFARSGRRCYACGDAIERVVVSSRRLYLCPTCQPA